MTRTATGRALAACAGILAALVGWELALRPLAGDSRVPPRPRVACDSLDGAVVETRQTDEGIARARYTTCGARLTGNAIVPGAPYVTLLGDSYVAAREVEDHETMGARLEALSRATAHPVNVRQYGWGGASPAQYVLAAPQVLHRWNPSRVVVLLSDDDLGANAVWGMEPRFRQLPGGHFTIDSTPANSSPVAPPTRVAHASALSGAMERRWAMVVARAPELVRRAVGPLDAAPQPLLDERDVPGVPEAVIESLARSYGDRLLIVYVADVRVSGGESASHAEQRLLSACQARQVACMTTRGAMLDARNAGVAVRGFSNTVAGLGHLNASGHDLLARQIWTALDHR
jgi:hypothetical protein